MRIRAISDWREAPKIRVNGRVKSAIGEKPIVQVFLTLSRRTASFQYFSVGVSRNYNIAYVTCGVSF